MAEPKKNTPKVVDENDILFVNPEQAVIVAKQNLIGESIKSYKDLETFENTYKDKTCAGIEDLTGYQFIADGAKKAKKMRTDVEKTRKKITAPALKFQKEVKAEADAITERVVLIENHLNEQKVAFENAKKAEEEKKFKERSEELTTNGWEIVSGNYVCGAVHLSPDQIRDFTEEQIAFHVDLGKKEVARKKAEEERIAKEKKDLADERAKMDAEREAMAAERAKFEKEKAELEAQRKALDETYKKTEEEPAEPVVEETPEPTEEVAPVETSPAPEPVAEDTTETVAPNTVDEDASPMVIGFEAFRTDLIRFLGNEKITRKSLTDFANTNQLDVF